MTQPPGRRPAVVVVGAINVDLVVHSDRLPGPGETVVGGSMRRYGGGKGANAAVAAARAGARTVLVGAVGDDDNGRTALAELAAEGVDVGSVAIVPDEATGVALIVVSGSGENQIAVGAGANLGLDVGHVRDALRRLVPEAGCVLVSTEIAPDAVRAAVDVATAAGVTCILNPAPVISAVLDLLDRGPVLSPNRSELADLRRGPTGAGPVAPDESPADSARTLAVVTGAPVVVTLGGDGALLVEPDAEPLAVPPRPADVRDTTGAGDTFNGVLAARMSAGDPLPDAVRTATLAASLSVEHVGARSGMPREDELVDDRLSV